LLWIRRNMVAAVPRRKCSRCEWILRPIVRRTAEHHRHTAQHSPTTGSSTLSQSHPMSTCMIRNRVRVSWSSMSSIPCSRFGAALRLPPVRAWDPELVAGTNSCRCSDRRVPGSHPGPAPISLLPDHRRRIPLRTGNGPWSDCRSWSSWWVEPAVDSNG